MDQSLWGILALLVIFVLFVVKLTGKAAGKAGFDERQLLARGKAYRAGFYALLAGALVSYLSMHFPEWRIKDPEILPFFCIWLGVTVFACVAIFNDAYVGFRQRPQVVLAMLAVVVVRNAYAAITELRNGGFADGITAQNGVNLIAAVMGLIVLIAFGLRLHLAAGDEE